MSRVGDHEACSEAPGPDPQPHQADGASLLEAQPADDRVARASDRQRLAVPADAQNVVAAGPEDDRAALSAELLDGCGEGRLRVDPESPCLAGRRQRCGQQEGADERGKRRGS
jgi:hypothetical protein